MIQPLSNYLLVELVRDNSPIHLPDTVQTVESHCFVVAAGPGATLEPETEVLISYGAKTFPLNNLWGDEEDLENKFLVREGDIVAVRIPNEDQ
jgi:co-chaperonin GroES (HSP10)